MKIETFWKDITLYHVTFIVIFNGVERAINKLIAIENHEDKDLVNIVQTRFKNVIRVESIVTFDNALLLKE